MFQHFLRVAIATSVVCCAAIGLPTFAHADYSPVPVDKACTVGSTLALSCNTSSPATVSGASSTSRLLVLGIAADTAQSTVRRLVNGAAHKLILGAPAAASVQIGVWPVPRAELDAGQLSTATTSSFLPSTKLTTLTGASGATQVSAGDSAIWAQSVLERGSSARAFVLRLETSTAATLCATLTSCVLSAEVRSAPLQFGGVRAGWTQPTLPLPLGGSLAVNAANGAAFLELYDSPSAGYGSCLRPNPQFNSVEATRDGAYGIGFESRAEQVRLTQTSDGLIARGPTGWEASAESVDRSISNFQTGDSITAISGSTDLAIRHDDQVWSIPQPTSGDPVKRPTLCYTPGVSPNNQYTYAGGLLASMAGSDNVTVTMARNGTGDITTVAGGSEEPETFLYDSGRLATVQVGELGTVDVTWGSVAGTPVPTRLDYDLGEQLEIAWEASAIGPVVSEAHVIEDGQETGRLEFVTSDGARVLRTADGDLPTRSVSSGAIVGPDTAAPILSDDLSDEGVPVYFSASASKAIIGAVVEDGVSGIKSYKVSTPAGTTVASSSRSCYALWTCERSRDLADGSPLALQSLPAAGAPLVLTLTDGVGNVRTIPATAVEQLVDPPPLEQIVVNNVSGSGSVKTVAIGWDAPDESLAAKRTYRWKQNAGAWTTSATLPAELTLTGLALGDIISLEVTATNPVSSASAVQTEQLTVNAAPSEQGRPASTIDPDMQGPSTNSVTLDLTTELPDGSIVPVYGSDVSFHAGGVRAKSGVNYDLKHVGTEVTDEDGTLTIPNTQEFPYTFTIGDEDYSVSAGAGARRLAVKIPFLPSVGQYRIKRERRWCARSRRRAGLCLNVEMARKRVQSIVPDYWTFPQSESTRPNALTHAYWNALVEKSRHHQLPVNRVTGFEHWTLRELRDLMKLHEYDDMNAPQIDRQRSSKMDFWNNARGREMGRNRKDWSQANLCRAVVQRSFSSTRGFWLPNKNEWRVGPVASQFVYYSLGPGNKVKRRNPPGNGCSEFDRGTRSYQMPAVVIGDGTRVTMTWNTSADIDLHVFDAAGHHAWYADAGAIPNARLSSDIVRGFGPELFTETGALGRAFTIGICYYAGSPATTVTVQIVDPDGTARTEVRQLNQPYDFAIIGASPTSAPLVVPSRWCPDGEIGSGGGGGGDGGVT